MNKKFIYFSSFLLLLLFSGFLLKKSNEDLPIERNEVSQSNLVFTALTEFEFTRSVPVIGKVESFDQAGLSFEQSGVVRGVAIKVGDLVSTGSTLLFLDMENARNQLIEAEANLNSEKIRLEELLAGERPERLAILESAITDAELTLAETERKTDEAIGLARNNFLNTDLRAYLSDPRLRVEEEKVLLAPTISGVYSGEKEGEYRISVFPSLSESGYSFNYIDPNSKRGTGAVSTRIPQRLGRDGLYILFPENFARDRDLEWIIPLPNDRSASYILLKDAYQNAINEKGPRIERAKENLNRLKQELQLLKFGGREEQTDLQKNRVKQAELSVLNANNLLNRRTLTAPFSGKILSVSTRVGETVSPGQVLVNISSEDRMKLVTYVSPEKSRQISIGDKVEIINGRDGEVFAKSSGVNEQTGQVEISIKFTEKNDLMPGEYQKAKILINDFDDTIWLPLSAIRVESTGKYILAMEDEKIIKLSIETGEIEGDRVRVLSGLEGVEMILPDARDIILSEIENELKNERM